MSEEMSYENANGDTVFTSKFLRARKTCCKTACLHCPYGFTLKKHGLQFRDWTPASAEEASGILREVGSGVELAPYLPDNVKFIELKGQVCGLLTKNHIVIKNLVLKKHFQDQQISREMVESYLF
jgi:hypothetical protein